VPPEGTPEVDAGHLPTDERDYLARLVNQLEAALGDDLVAVWLFGSAAYGGYEQGRSDLDVQAAVRRRLAEVQLDSMVAAVVGGSSAMPAPAIELVVHLQANLVGPELPVPWLLNLECGPARPLHDGRDHRSEPPHWFVLDLAMGRDHGRALYGPRPADVIGPVPREAQVEAIVQSIEWHEHLEPGHPDRLANAARGLRYIRTGTWGSKPAGLVWLAEAYCDRAVTEAEIAEQVRAELDRS